MYKYLFLFVFFFNISYGQTTINSVLNESWEISKIDLLQILKTKNYEEKKVMGYSGYLVSDTLNFIPVNIGYFFNSNGIQTMRGISNSNKSEEASKKLFNLLFSSLNELLGNTISDNEMLGSRMIQWENKKHKIILFYNSDTCMLSIIR